MSMGASAQRRRTSGRDGERGTITVFVLGLCVAILFLGGFVVDFWRVIAARRALSSMADAAAVAGANGLDQSSLRTGGVALDPTAARSLAYDELRREPRAADITRASVATDRTHVVVRLHTRVRFSLLGLLLRGSFDVGATATAVPRRGP